jgi:hypothetical protein
MKRQYWTPADVRALRRLYPNMGNEAIGARLGRTWSAVQNMAVKLGLRKTAAFLRSPECRFQQGDALEPWRHRLHGRQPDELRQGPHAAQPSPDRLGAHDEGRLSRAQGREPKRWRAVHVINWEAAYGPVKRGFIVVHKNPANRLDNLPGKPGVHQPRGEHAAQHLPPLPERDREADPATRRPQSANQQEGIAVKNKIEDLGITCSRRSKR